MSESSASPEASRARSHLGRRIVVGAVILLVACLAWVGIRGVLAKNHLEKAVSVASSVEAAVKSGDSASAEAGARRLSHETNAAERLTGDPIWRAAEILPLVGPNLTVVRRVSVIVADVSDGAITPLTRTVGSIASVRPVDGAVDLHPLTAARPTIARAAKDLEGDLREARRLDTTRTVTPVNSAVEQLVTAMTTASSAATAADQAVSLLPEMMGGAGPKNYLLLFQNNAELRASGGIPGAMALIHADEGRLTLTGQASSADFSRAPDPVVKLPTETAGLYGRITGEYIQDVTLTPKFALSARIARAMWQQKYGTTVDGVLAIDPVALSYLLGATGDVPLPTGDVLTSSNVVETLLSGTYSKYPDPGAQDVFFAGAAGAIFSKVAAGTFDPQTFVSALARAASERRLLLWSADPAQQKTLAKTALAGALPRGTTTRPAFGVYVNDGTGAKMDYYLRARIERGQASCRKDGRVSYEISVTLTNGAPADAASFLPPYVTGTGAYGVAPGDVRTNVIVYAPKTSVFVSAEQDGKTAPVQTATDSGHPVAQLGTLLGPGKSTTFSLLYIGPVGATTVPSIEHTPLTSPVPVRKSLISCGNRLQ